MEGGRERERERLRKSEREMRIEGGKRARERKRSSQEPVVGLTPAAVLPANARRRRRWFERRRGG